MVKVLHVNNIARIGSALVRQARSRGLDWSLYDTARTDSRWSARTRALRRALRGAAWETGLARRALGTDLLDVHGATVTAHTRWLRLPYVLHLHGSDIRQRQYEERYAPLVRRAVLEACDVYYTTPDLAEHVAGLRQEATLQPVIVDTTEIPQAVAADGPARFLFPSRWDASKGGAMQIAVLAALRSAYGGSLLLEGLDWGQDAGQAAAHGVKLLPKMGHGAYVRWIASGTAAIGQMTGCMGVSELEAIGSGVSLIMALNPQWYDGAHPTTRDVPVLAGPVAPAEAVDAIVEAVGQVLNGERVNGGRQWVAEHHSPAAAVDRLLSRPVFGGPH